MAVKYFQIENLLVSLKSIATSIITGVVTFIPVVLGMFLVQNNFVVVGRLIQLSAIILYIQTWGFFARRFWGFK